MFTNLYYIVTADNTSFVPDGLEPQCIDDNLINKSDLPFEMTQSMYGEKFRKTLRLSSEQIVSYQQI